MDGTFINNEGRAQRFRRLMEPGIPVKELLEDGHPPRRHLLEQPGGDLREAWCIVADLLRLLAPEFGREPFSGIWGGLRDLDPEGEGMVVLP
jgi:NADH-quinone oxidoreductase subunit G